MVLGHKETRDSKKTSFFNDFVDKQGTFSMRLLPTCDHVCDQRDQFQVNLKVWVTFV